MENNIESLLTEVAKIAQSKKEREKAALIRGEKFNIFELLGLQTDETRLHSNLLAELLNPKGNHGLGDEPLKLFLRDICKNQLPNFDKAHATIEKEHFISNIAADYNSGGRVDILIQDTADNKHKNAIIIENKIYAGDQYKQLYRYRNFAKDRYENFIILYLNLLGNPASQDSEGSHEIDKVSSGEDYIPISYKYDIIPWLKQCRTLAIDKPYVREILGLYINTLKSLTENDMNNTEKNELLKYMDDHIEASAEIISVRNDFCSYLVREHLIPKLLEWANKYDLKCDDSESFATGKIYSGISFSKPEWNRSLRLEFEKDNFRDLIYGIVGYKDKVTPNKIDFAGLKKPNDTWHYGWARVNPYGFLYPNNYVYIKNGDVAKTYIMILNNLYQAIIENGIEM